jgi:hypothetical protein
LTESGAAHSVPSKGGLVLSPPSPPLNYIIWDLETDGLGDHPEILVGVAYSSRTNWPYIYYRRQVQQLAEALEAADVTITFNGKGYDMAVLQENVGRRVRVKHHIDLLEEIQSKRPAFERGWRLDDIAVRMWGAPKQTESSAIPEMWARGEHAAVVSHCLQDVYFTRCLFEHLRDREWIIAPDNSNARIEVPDWWKLRMKLLSDFAPSVPVTSI